MLPEFFLFKYQLFYFERVFVSILDFLIFNIEIFVTIYEIAHKIARISSDLYQI